MYNRLPIEPHGIGICTCQFQFLSLRFRRWSSHSNFLPSDSNAGAPIPIPFPLVPTVELQFWSPSSGHEFRKVGWFCTIIQFELGYPNSQAGRTSACCNGLTQDIITWWNPPSTVCSLVLKAGNVVGTLETGEGNSTESTDHITGWFCSIKQSEISWTDQTWL